jgi:hypothetical protein
MIVNHVWPDDEYISLWTYKDSNEIGGGADTTWGFNASTLWSNTIDRILLADKGLEKILGNCVPLKPVFAKRIINENVQTSDET